MKGSEYMNELSAIAQETHETAIAYFKVAEQYGYKFIMQVKEIRDKQYYKALGFNSFDDYCEVSWKCIRQFMDERIKIADAFGNERDFASTYSQLGHTKSLFLAQLPESIDRQQFLEQSHTIPSTGETKTVDDMTVKELREVKKAQKEAEERAAKAEKEAEAERQSRYHFEKLWNQAKSAPTPLPQKVTVEVPPPDYEKVKDDLHRLSTENIQLTRANQTLQDKIAEQKVHDNALHNIREMRKCFKEMLSALTTQHRQARFHYEQIYGNAEAFQVADAALREIDSTVSSIFNEWKRAMEVTAS